MAGFGSGSGIASVAATATVPITAPPETPKLPPSEWVKANLFSSPFNSVLTVVSTPFLLAVFRPSWRSSSTPLDSGMPRPQTCD